MSWWYWTVYSILMQDVWNHLSGLISWILADIMESIFRMVLNICDLLWRNREQVGVTSYSLSRNKQSRLVLSNAITRGNPT